MRHNKNISIVEAIKTIKEWGVDCDEFVAYNCKQTIVDGEADDNSIELTVYFMKCLEIVTNLGMAQSGQPTEADLLSKMLEKLEEIRCGLIDIEDAINKTKEINAL